MATQMTIEDIQMHMDENAGWCTVCEEVTNYGVEPDARRYECDECGAMSVYGMEEALMMGAFS